MQGYNINTSKTVLIITSNIYFQFKRENTKKFPQHKHRLFSSCTLFECVFLSCQIHVLWREPALCSCPNVNKLFARNRRDIWRSSDCNGIRTYNHLVRKRTLNHSANLVKWLGCVVSTGLHGVFDYVLLSYHVHVLELITVCSCLNVNEHTDKYSEYSSII